MWMMSYPGSYLPLFNASARALKDVHPYVAIQLQDFTRFHGYTSAQYLCIATIHSSLSRGSSGSCAYIY
eukprot:COSAG02_NODE_2438_length_8864_cov_23.127781_11_plen_69_part_00